jgi:hypothetical protein
VLALGRNGFWVMYFIYTPIYVANAGYPPEVGGALVSLGLVPMLLVRVYGRLGGVIGTRNVLSIGYGLAGLFSLAAAAAALAGMPVACMTLLCIAAFAATIIDGAGNVPFLRAVHHYERAPMTSVFMTFRHVGALVVPGVLAAAAALRVRGGRADDARDGGAVAVYPPAHVGRRGASAQRTSGAAC